VLRYLYRERAFQVVVDGRTGKILFGKAPGNTWYRAAFLVIGMAVGAFLALDLSSLILFSSSDDSAFAGVIVGIIGLAIMGLSYRRFRYGEQYEYRNKKEQWLNQQSSPIELLGQFKDLEQWINRLS
jgi:hypothetical protein